ncbi:MAG: hypothetical protein NC935_06545 [Candidatus Omnitrophica bacterium]|nr:hypothetical protein [Candidatus Omnitrophota bacterium]
MAEQINLTEEEIRNGAPFAALSYCLFLWILAFIFCKKNNFAHFHAKQGIVIFIGEVIFAILSLLPIVGKFFYIIGLVVFLWLSVIGIYSALTGNLKRFPIISNIADKFII